MALDDEGDLKKPLPPHHGAGKVPGQGARYPRQKPVHDAGPGFGTRAIETARDALARVRALLPDAIVRPGEVRAGILPSRKWRAPVGNGADQRAPAQQTGVLVATGLQKSYKGRQVVRGVTSAFAAARRSACSAPTAPARPPAST